MEQRRKIDNSLKERHGIIHLLEKMKQDGITIAEMEEIGAKLGKSGKRALSPLVRRLWREKSGDLISRYTYLLDFFDDEVWIDQLIQIALRRRDLEEEGKAALLAALEEYGVDVSAPPLATLLARDGGPLRTTLPRLLGSASAEQIRAIKDHIEASAYAHAHSFTEATAPQVLSATVKSPASASTLAKAFKSRLALRRAFVRAIDGLHSLELPERFDWIGRPCQRIASWLEAVYRGEALEPSAEIM